MPSAVSVLVLRVSTRKALKSNAEVNISMAPSHLTS